MKEAEPKCQDCGKALKSKRNLAEHKRIHTGEKPYTCGHCGRKFSHKNTYCYHTKHKICIKQKLQIDLGDRWICEECGKALATKQSLEVHNRRHKGEKPYTCGRCGKKFTNLASHSYHRKHSLCTKQKLQEGHDYRFKCKECDKSFNRRWDWLEHYQLHKKRENTYQCTNCGNTFSHSADHEKHIKDMVCIKENIKEGHDYRFKCKECDKSFNRRWEWLEHYQLHKKRENTYQCTNCGNNFSHSVDHQKHIKDMVCIKENIKIDMGDKWMSKDCGKSLENKKSFSVHRQIHTDHKPYACALCGRKFTEYKSHFYHMKHKVCTKQISEKREERDDLWNPELEIRPVTAEKHFKETENIQPTAAINPQYSRSPWLYKRPAQSGLSRDKLFSYSPSSRHPQNNDNNNLEQRQISKQRVEKDYLRNSELECRPVTAEKHFQEAENIQPTAPIDPQYSRSSWLYKQTVQFSLSRDKFFSYPSSSRHPQDNGKNYLEPRQIAEQQVQYQPLDLSKHSLIEDQPLDLSKHRPIEDHSKVVP